MKSFIHVVCLVVLFTTAGQAQAGIIVNNVGISSPDKVITFDEFTFAEGTPITNQFSSLGASFSPNLYYNVQPEFFPTASLASFIQFTTQNNVSIFFNDDVTAAAVALQSNTERTTFTAKLNGSVVESFTTLTTLSSLPSLTNASDFYGFEGIVFDELRIENNSQIFQIDNLQFVTVPEPGSLAFFGLVAGVVGFVSGRRRRCEQKQTALA